jgi:hypothetical protein
MQRDYVINTCAVLFGLRYLNCTTAFAFGNVGGEARGVNNNKTSEYLAVV